jgi:hypothetical protein
VERKSWSPVIIAGVMLGAGLGALLALILIRRRREDGAGVGEIPWRDLLTLIGPIVVLARRLVEISRRQMIELERR